MQVTTCKAESSSSASGPGAGLRGTAADDAAGGDEGLEWGLGWMSAVADAEGDVTIGFDDS